jgi:DNA-binding CsgD family transcriptional regulator
MAPSYGIGVALVRPIALALSDLGEDGDGFLSDLGVDDSTRQEHFIPTATVDRALDAIARRRGEPAFGLTLCRASARNPLGFFGHLVWLSSTLRESLARAARFYALVTQRVYLDMQEHGDGSASITQRLRPGAERGTVLTEFAAATVALRYQQATQGRFKIRGVRFIHATAFPETYEAFFDAPVTFEQTEDRIVIDASSLDTPLPFSDPHTTAALENHAQKLSVPPSASLESRVRAVLRDRYGMTHQQTALVLCVHSGMRNREIAQELQLTEGTVKQYLSRIYEILGVEGRTELAVLVADLGGGAA